MTNEEVAVKLAEHENRIKVNEHRVSDLEETTKRIESLTLSVQKLATSVEQMAKDQVIYRDKQNKLSEDLLKVESRTESKIAEIKNAPSEEKAKKYDAVVKLVLELIISAVVGFVLCYFGIK